MDPFFNGIIINANIHLHSALKPEYSYILLILYIL
jgi:hypothetical protein